MFRYFFLINCNVKIWPSFFRCFGWLNPAHPRRKLWAGPVWAPANLRQHVRLENGFQYLTELRFWWSAGSALFFLAFRHLVLKSCLQAVFKGFTTFGAVCFFLAPLVLAELLSSASLLISQTFGWIHNLIPSFGNYSPSNRPPPFLWAREPQLRTPHFTSQLWRLNVLLEAVAVLDVFWREFGGRRVELLLLILVGFLLRRFFLLHFVHLQLNRLVLSVFRLHALRLQLPPPPLISVH